MKKLALILFVLIFIGSGALHAIAYNGEPARGGRPPAGVHEKRPDAGSRPVPFPMNNAGQAACSKVEEMPLFAQAKKASPDRYKFAVEKGAEFSVDPDGRSFYISWFPKNAVKNGKTPVVVTLHGHGSYAFDEFFIWYPYLEKRGYGIVALQWWFGKGETAKDYYMPNELYRNIDRILSKAGVKPGKALLHGFSRGSANSYGVTAFDAAKGKRYFLLTIANAGQPGRDFPPNMEIEKGIFGPKPFARTYWVTYAGVKDENPDRDGVNGMRYAKEWVEKFGGEVYLAIEDANGGHGGFHQNPKNVEAALDVFAKLLSGQR